MLDIKAVIHRRGVGPRVLYAVFLALTAGIFVFDLLTPLGYTEWLLYFIPLLLLSRAPRPGLMYVAAGTFTLVMVLGFVFSSFAVPYRMGLFNRLLGIGMFWITAYTLVRRRRADAIRRNGEEALRASEERYRNLFDYMQEGFAYCRMFFENGQPRDFLYLSVNRAFETLTGLKDVTGKRVSEIIPGIRESDPGVFEAYGRVALGGAPEKFDIFLVALRQWFSISVYCPERGCFVAIFDVITERKRAEEALRRSHEELEERIRERTAELSRSNLELEQFASVASHDLQEPLRMVSGFVQLLSRRYKGKLDADADELIGHIVEGAGRMRELVEGLLAYSRIQSRGRAPSPVSLAAALERALRNLQAAIREAGAVVTKDPLPVLSADPVQMVQLFQNLVGNAVKFRRSDEPPRIHVTAAPADGEWIVSVTDNGIGIDPGDHGKLFTLFRRLHARQKYPGTGIGLALCRRIVERHGGRIWVESGGSGGSAFRFTMPRRKPDAESAGQSPEREAS